ncbi:MAG: type secretion system lysozyme, partial [Rhodocyclales bacterium]|nr:type secretion system lysozyme [Rhodocyclales bacterium]
SMAELLPQDRLQPALLDRLRDDHPDQKQEPKESRILTKPQLREAVLRDLSWLLNATRPSERDGLSGYPEAERSVLNYGMPSFSGETASSLDVTDLEQAVREALLAFEPRIVDGTLRVEAVQQESVLDWHNVVSVRIEASIWAQPVPLELMLRTEVDLETGQVQINEMSGR